jgi:hypothetical protein
MLWCLYSKIVSALCSLFYDVMELKNRKICVRYVTYFKALKGQCHIMCTSGFYTFLGLYN